MLVNKPDISGFIDNSVLDKKITIAEHDDIVKLQVFDSIYLCGKSHSEDCDTQNYLVFWSVHRYFKKY